MDVKLAFLNDEIKEIYIAQPPGFELPNLKDNAS